MAQVGLSLVLLVGAGLFARSLRNLGATDLGLARENLLLMDIRPATTLRHCGNSGRSSPKRSRVCQEYEARRWREMPSSATAAGMRTSGRHAPTSNQKKAE